MKNYQIFTDSSSDLTSEMRQQYGIDYFRMAFTVDGKEIKADLDFKLYSYEQLYEWIRDPNVEIKTSLVKMQEFIDRLTPYLEKGIDILYIACTTVLSGTLNFFRLAAEELKEKYPERKIIGIDSSRAGMTLGIMVMDACKLQNEGKSMEEIISFVEKEKQKYNLCGTVETLTYLKNAGRVSGAAAFFANMFGIKPIIVADTKGHNYVIGKVKGMRTAYEKLFEIVKDTVEGQAEPTIYVGQGFNQEAEDYFTNRFTKELNAKIVKYKVGPIIGISCGPGVIHIVCKGKEMTITAPEE